MLSHAYEFIRIADISPDANKLALRKESASDIANLVSTKANRELMLSAVQGVIAGFEGFKSDAPIVTAIIKAIKDRDVALPNGLSENAQELRAVAAMGLGESLVKQGPKPEAVNASLAIRSALSLRPDPKEKHLKTALSLLLTSAEELLASTAALRRQRAVTALNKLLSLEEPNDPKDVWKTLTTAIRGAMREFHFQSQADREEIESLWWAFQGYSEVEKKPLSEMSSAAVAICAGIELANRAVVPPIESAGELVRYAVSKAKKGSQPVTCSLQEFLTECPLSAATIISPGDGQLKEIINRYPAIFPVAFACGVNQTSAGKLPRTYFSVTGLPATLALSTVSWGRQLFNERILSRVLQEPAGS